MHLLQSHMAAPHRSPDALPHVLEADAVTDRQRIGRNNRVRGAAVERWVARLVGGWRNIDRGGKWGDVQTVDRVVEVKSRQTPTPTLISGAWAQAVDAAEHTGKEPSVVICYIDGGKRSAWEVRRLK